MPTAREIDDNGFLLIKACPITSFGIFDYSAGQLGLPGDPMRIVKVFRPEEAVNDPAAIESFKNVPLINDHEMLSGFQNDKDSTAPEDYGVSGILTSNIYYAKPWMLGDLKVFSREMQALLGKGKKDLSLGYSCDFEEKPGVWQGQAYEVVQTNMRGNHIALVDEGRVPGARVLDGLCFDHLSFDFKPSDKENNMPKSKKAMDKAARDSAVEELKTLVPALAKALEGFLAEEGAEAAHQEGAAPQPGQEPANVDQGGQGEQQPAPAPEANAETGAATSETPSAGQEGGGDILALIEQAKATLAKLEAAAAGCQPGADDGEQKPTNDNIEGLQENGNPNGAQVGTDGEGEGQSQGNDNEGGEMENKPGTKAEDASVGRFYADLATKTSLYNRLSKVVGAFDHSRMDARQVGVYGVKKLGLQCADGMEGLAVDAFLSATEAANKRAGTQVTQAVTDGAESACPEIDAYLKGGQ
jgi:hypothetical protein